jgi:hypothetical protein
MFNGSIGGEILTCRSSGFRDGVDFYETPEDVTEALLRFLEEKKLLKPCSFIWEPACGKGKMQRVMLDHGHAVIATDLHPHIAGIQGVDFLSEVLPCEWIITNPPFSKAEEFIKHAMEMQKSCAFLLKSQFWHAKKRYDLFWENPPAYVLPLTWRPDFLSGDRAGHPTMECAWTVWCGKPGATEYVPLERPKMKKETRDE